MPAYNLPEILHVTIGACGPIMNLKMKSVFLCHSNSDKPFVKRLASDLTALGLPVWYDEWEIRVGESIVEKITIALTDSDILVLVMSPAAVKSKWVQREFNASLMRSLSQRNIRVLPVLFQRSEIPAIIADVRYADFTRDYQVGFGQLLVGLGIAGPVPAYLTKAISVVDSLKDSDLRWRSLITHTFSDYPGCLFKEGKLDATIVLGGSEREHAEETELFRQPEANVDLFGTSWSFSRQITPGTVRDASRAVDLAAYLGFEYCRQIGSTEIYWANANRSLCVLDVSVNSDVLRGNMILVGGGDTNVFIPIAAMAVRQKYGFTIPICYPGDDRLHFTCDAIVSGISGRTYSRLEDSSFMHCGYVTMVANPWAEGKVIIFAVGTRATGTQAALLSLTRGPHTTSSRSVTNEPWQTLRGNNRFDARVPAKVVRATAARIVKGHDFLGDTTDIIIHDKTRISQRHIVTDFEFLE